MHLPKPDSIQLTVHPQHILTFSAVLRPRVVGAYFGTTFPHLFFQTFPELLPSPGPQPRLGMRLYIPKIYGFRVRPSVYIKLI